jgi:hypothetical protein
MKKEMQKANGQVPEHYRKQLLKTQERVEKATKVSKRAESQGSRESVQHKELHYICPARYTKW